jgi:transcriptional regulator with PAS, ATPase and Fis domain
LIAERTFREDFYYRINVFQLRVPALKERKEDVSLIAQHFLTMFNIMYRKSITGFTDEAIKKLQSHNWPGNIRELRNVIERVVLFCTASAISGDLIEFDLSVKNDSYREVNSRLLCKTEPEIVRSLLEKHNGKVSAVVKALHTSNGALYHFMKKHSINQNEYRKGL